MAEPCCENPSSTRNLRPAAAPPPPESESHTLSRVDLARPSGDELPGRFIGDYEVLGELGRGGMGVVYKARHRGLGRVVALKMVLGSRFARVEELLRFRLEGEAAASLQHPNIVQLFEVGTHQDQPYLVLEHVEGGPLSGRLKRGRLTVEQSTRLVEALAGAVQVAHNQGIVHRDLKPGNVLLAADGTPKITDFGLAKQMDRGAAGLTETGRVLGTPQYMAPEQAAGRSREVGPHTDIYALGAILYDLVTGRPPFVAGDAADTLIQVLTCEAIRRAASMPACRATWRRSS
ncbi:MAG: serine/threonine-protein kinase [Gemmataceae bacterium]